MSDELFETLKENFPILEKLEGGLRIKVNEQEKLCLDTKYSMELTQQDCLELSQLFALLATGFEESEKTNDGE